MIFVKVILTPTQKFQKQTYVESYLLSNFLTVTFERYGRGFSEAKSHWKVLNRNLLILEFYQTL